MNKLIKILLIIILSLVVIIVIYRLNKKNTYGLIIPAYIYPDDEAINSEYKRIINMKERYSNVPIIVILNVHNGPGEEKKDSYVEVIDILHDAKITIIGYIYDDYGVKTEDQVYEEMNKWISYYPEISGFFIDEVLNEDKVPNRYKNYKKYSEELGLNILVGNPGTIVSNEYMNVFDITVIAENEYINFNLDKLKEIRNPNDTKATLSYNTQYNEEYIDELLEIGSWIYITDRSEDYWSYLPSKFENIIEYISTKNYK